MKKIFILAAIALMGFASCADSKQSMTVTVTNPLALERTGEMVEVPMSDVTAKLQLADTAQIVVLGEDGQQVPYQVTYDEKVVFPATVKANGTATYTIQSGTPDPYNVIACGRYYPERLDDVAWENDLADTVPMALPCRSVVNVVSATTSLRSITLRNRFLKVFTLKNWIRKSVPELPN